MQSTGRTGLGCLSARSRNIIFLKAISLDSIDFDDLRQAYDTFYESCGNPVIKDSSVKMVFGIEIGGAIFDIAEFSGNATDEDYIEAERRGLVGVAGFCFVAGQQVSRLRQSDGDRTIEGPLNIRQLMRLDSIDLLAIMTASQLWKKSTRLLAGLAGVSDKAALEIAASGGPVFDCAINRLLGHLEIKTTS